MTKLFTILGLFGALTGAVINYNEISEVFTSSEYTAVEKEAAAEYVTGELEESYNKLLNGEPAFGKHLCNNF